VAVDHTARIAGARWPVWGSIAVVRVTERAALLRACALVRAELDAIDAACSRFREDSEISRVNAAHGRAVRVGPVLREAVALALAAARLTDGDVDPTVGSALTLSGYDRDWSLLARDRGEPPPEPPPTRAVTLLALAGWRAVELDQDRETLRVPLGVSLDLGATAKALAADRAAARVSSALGCGVLVSLGGDIATAGPAPVGGWKALVSDDHRGCADAPGQTVSIVSGGLATSSTAVRRWSHRGQTMHHVIDPATQLPAIGPWRTVSVAAADCAQANIVATAAIVRGARAVTWLDELGIAARLQRHDGRVMTIAGWPGEQHDEARPS